MKKSHWNAIVDALLVVVMLIVLAIGILLGFFIDWGGGPEAQKYLWELHRHDWGDLHLYFAIALVGLVILHFILHISWIRSMSKQCLHLHWLVTLLVLIILAAGILWASIAVKKAYPGGYEQEERGLGSGGGGRGRQSGEEGLRPGGGGGRGQGGSGGLRGGGRGRQNQ